MLRGWSSVGTLSATIALGAVVALIGCSPSEESPTAGTESGRCPDDLPDACASPVSYSADVATVVALRCATCHSPGAGAGNHDFAGYHGIYRERRQVLSQVYGCRMPPPGADPLTPLERETLLSWLVCGAPP